MVSTLGESLFRMKGAFLSRVVCKSLLKRRRKATAKSIFCMYSIRVSFLTSRFVKLEYKYTVVSLKSLLHCWLKFLATPPVSSRNMLQTRVKHLNYLNVCGDENIEKEQDHAILSFLKSFFLPIATCVLVPLRSGGSVSSISQLRMNVTLQHLKINS